MNEMNLSKALAIAIILLFLAVSVIPSIGTVMIQKELPTELIIEGPTHGKVGVTYIYKFYLTDSEGCDLWLNVDWDDGINTGWLGPFDSEEGAYLPHVWDECGIYTIRAGAKGCNDSYYNATLEVTITSGNILYVGGSGPGNYTKIQDAIDNSSHGDTVYVYNDSSPYYENINVNKSINLVGENRETTTIDGNESGDVVSISTDWVNISGFTIQNSGYEAGIKIISNHNTITGNIISNNRMGIALHQSNDNTINENTISSNNEGGIDIDSSNDNTVWMNKIFQNKYRGILVFNSNGNIISSNEIYENSLAGISIQNGDYNRIIGNLIYGHYSISGTWGITSFKENYGNIISENTIINNRGGISYMGVSNEISKNNITNNIKFGIYLNSPGWLPCKKNNIIQNNISNNEYGILIFWADGNTIENNNVYNNKYGVALSESRRNLIKKNNIIMNEIQSIFVLSRLNFWDSNFWDDWRGFAPYLVYGTLVLGPFEIPWINLDWRPAQEPYDIPNGV